MEKSYKLTTTNLKKCEPNDLCFVDTNEEFTSAWEMMNTNFGKKIRKYSVKSDNGI